MAFFIERHEGKIEKNEKEKKTQTETLLTNLFSTTFPIYHSTDSIIKGNYPLPAKPPPRWARIALGEVGFRREFLQHLHTGYDHLYKLYVDTVKLQNENASKSSPDITIHKQIESNDKELATQMEKLIRGKQIAGDALDGVCDWCLKYQDKKKQPALKTLLAEVDSFLSSIE